MSYPVDLWLVYPWLSLGCLRCVSCWCILPLVLSVITLDIFSKWYHTGRWQELKKTGQPRQAVSWGTVWMQCMVQCGLPLTFMTKCFFSVKHEELCSVAVFSQKHTKTLLLPATFQPSLHYLSVTNSNNLPKTSNGNIIYFTSVWTFVLNNIQLQ